MRARGAAVAVPAMVGSLWVQAHRAAHAALPEYEDLDVTGYYGTARAVTPDPVRVAVVGDSTLTGPGLDHARQVFVARAADRLASSLHLTRHAVGGSRIADVLMRQLPVVLDQRPDIAVISVGANDAIHSTPLAQFERDFRAVVGALDRAGIDTLVCGLIDLGSIPRVPAALKPLLALRGAAYERRKIRATHPAARAAYVGVGRRVNEAFRARGEEFFVADRFHPSAAGHRCLAEALTEHLEPLVRRARTMRVDGAKLSAWPTPCATTATVTSRPSPTTARSR
jgi:lysophospholipase L1-like esterase